MPTSLIPSLADQAACLPAACLAVTIVVNLLVPFFFPRPNHACGTVALLGLIAALWASFHVGGADAGLGQMLVADRAAECWDVMLMVFAGGIVLVWFAATSDEMHEADGPVFFTLLLGATMGLSLMGSAANLVMIFVAVESASLPSYVLAGFRKTHRHGAEASLKYVLFGAACTAVMIYGLSLLYGATGSLALYGQDGVASAFAASAHPLPILVGLVGLLTGLGFKMAAVPFHFWCPDVFEGAGIDVSAFLSVASKGGGLVLLLRVAMALAEACGFRPEPRLLGLSAGIAAMGIVTMTLGNTAAFVQTNIKRLLAYSSIANAGYMIAGISLLTRVGPHAPASSDVSGAVLLFLAVYMFTNLGAFLVAAVVAQRTGHEELTAFAGLGKRSRFLAACMTVFCLSFISLPPMAGCTAKFNLMLVIGEFGGWRWIVVGAIGANTVASVYYYARIVRKMYLNPPEAGDFSPNLLARVICLTCATILVVLFVGFNPLRNLTAGCTLWP
jgi:NADH-quinone oxidoreductase subunit N